MRITTICENRAPRSGLLGEHGLAMLLELRGRRILFDTGAGATLAGNAAALNLDLTRLDAVVLSHGHHDHTGGLKWVLEKRGSASLPVYAHPDALAEKYVSREDKAPEYIGAPWKRAEMEALGAEFRLERGPVDLGDGLIITGEIPRAPHGRRTPWPFLHREGGAFAEDRLLDDQALVVESGAGLIVLLGCAHAGVVETLRHVLALTGERRIYALLGGTHLLHTPEEQLKETVKELKHFGLEIVAPCHCSGIQAVMAMHRAFGKSCLDHQAGSIFELPL